MKKLLLFLLIISTFINSIYAKENNCWNIVATIPFLIICIFFIKIYSEGEKSLEIKKIILFSATSVFLSFILVMVLYTKNSYQLTIALNLFYGIRLTFVFGIIISYLRFWLNKSFIFIGWILIAAVILTSLFLVFSSPEKKIWDIFLFLCTSFAYEASSLYLE